MGQVKKIDEDAFRRVKHSLEVEGFNMSKEDEKEIKDVILGKKTQQEMIKSLTQNA